MLPQPVSASVASLVACWSPIDLADLRGSCDIDLVLSAGSFTCSSGSPHS